MSTDAHLEAAGTMPRTHLDESYVAFLKAGDFRVFPGKAIRVDYEHVVWVNVLCKATGEANPPRPPQRVERSGRGAVRPETVAIKRTDRGYVVDVNGTHGTGAAYPPEFIPEPSENGVWVKVVGFEKLFP